ncbi:MAG TPA: hypothetical protein VLA12_04510 [Planctomycetaceae bacterium]|nr:hypothetical protein [Planctomycetaceae bacterium]
MRRFFVLFAAIALFGLALTSPEVASACPNCKAAISTDEKQPTAYMYSILFMLGMPALIFGAFGYGLYRMSLRENSLEPLPPLEEPSESFSRG